MTCFNELFSTQILLFTMLVNQGILVPFSCNSIIGEPNSPILIILKFHFGSEVLGNNIYSSPDLDVIYFVLFPQALEPSFGIGPLSNEQSLIFEG